MSEGETRHNVMRIFTLAEGFIGRGTPTNAAGDYDRDTRTALFFQKHQFTILVSASQIVFLILFGLFGRYDANTMPDGSNDDVYTARLYPMFQDTHVMIFIGFGFLMTFLKRYGFSALSTNLLLAVFTIEWGMIVQGFLSHEFADTGKFTIGLEELLTADFTAATILITMGAMLGKLSPTQYVVMAFIETAVALFIEHHVLHTFHVNDVGDSMVVHAFGAYFGLACSKVFGTKSQREHENEGSIYHSDIYAEIGAIFLWVFWPSFNAAAASPTDARQRAISNTFLSLCACTVTTFIFSQAVDKHKKFDMVHIANSTLAGGVAIGSIANVVLEPMHAMLMGVAAGALSVVGYKYITPMLSNKFGCHDTCGVNNLHGMPGVLAGLMSAVFVVTYDPARYGKRMTNSIVYLVGFHKLWATGERVGAEDINEIYPAMKSETNLSGTTAWGQALYQLTGLGLVLFGSLISGMVTGFILKIKAFNQVRDEEFYADGDYFETPADYDFITRTISRNDRVEIDEQQLTQKEV